MDPRLLLLLLFERLPRLIEVVAEDGFHSPSLHFPFFSRASIGAAGAYERRYACKLRRIRGCTGVFPQRRFGLISKPQD